VGSSHPGPGKQRHSGSIRYAIWTRTNRCAESCFHACASDFKPGASGFKEQSDDTNLFRAGRSDHLGFAEHENFKETLAKGKYSVDWSKNEAGPAGPKGYKALEIN